MGKFEEYGKITKQEFDYIIQKAQAQKIPSQDLIQKMISIFNESDADGNKCIEGEELELFNNKINSTEFIYLGPKIIHTKIKDGWTSVSFDENTIVENTAPMHVFFMDARGDFKRYQQNLPYEIFDCSANKKTIDNESIEHFNRFLQNNNSNLSEDKLKLLNEIKQLLTDGKISFKDAITDTRLQELSQLEDKYLYLFVRSADLAEKDEALNNEIVQDLLNEDYSAFDKLTNKNEYHRDNLRIVLDKYKEIKGVSFYNNLINLYENNDISKETFIQNMSKILKSYNTENLPMLLENQEAFNIEQFKNFDFDKYVAENINYNNEEYTNTNSQYFNYLHLEQPLDLKDTWVEPYLPKIENISVNQNTIIQKFNNREFKIEYSDDLISITNTKNNKLHELNLNTLLRDIENTEDRKIIKNAILKLPAPVLIDMERYISFISVTHELDTDVNADTDRLGHITINLANTKNLETRITHELGHNVCLNRNIKLTGNEIMKNLKNTKISNDTIIQKFNNQDYVIKFKGNETIVYDNNKNKYTIKHDKIYGYGRTEFFIKSMNQLPAPMLIKLSMLDKIFYGPHKSIDINDNSLFIYGSIELDTLATTSSLCGQIYDKMSPSNNVPNELYLEFLNKFKEGYKNYKQVIKGNAEHINVNGELDSEMYALFMLGSSDDSNENIVNYYKAATEVGYKLFNQRLEEAY